ncbi:LPS translocon maturation chaperone LptM [Sessilibacter sp. MAH2]
MFKNFFSSIRNMRLTFAKRLALATTVLVYCVVVSGCGQTGPLYLPEDKPETPKTTSK